jgi:hypothetical protein
LELMNKTGYYKADNSIFVGHNVFSLNQFTGAEYLSEHELNKEMKPTEHAPRVFEKKRVDFSADYVDSLPVDLYGGRESLPYRLNDFNGNDFSIETVNARKL